MKTAIEFLQQGKKARQPEWEKQDAYIQLDSSATVKWYSDLEYECSDLFHPIWEEYVEPFEYPLFKRWKDSGEVVKFTGLQRGETVWEGKSVTNDVGYKSATFVAHTDEDWEDVAYDKERGLWDKQPVYCWDTSLSFYREISFYDAKNKCLFSFASGTRKGFSFENYSPVEKYRYDDWLLEAYTKLDIDPDIYDDGLEDCMNLED